MTDISGYGGSLEIGKQALRQLYSSQSLNTTVSLINEQCSEFLFF